MLGDYTITFMEKILRKKFITFSIIAVAVVLVLLVAVVNITNYLRVDDRVDSALEMLASGEDLSTGTWLDNYDNGLDTLTKYYLEKYYLVNVDHDGNVVLPILTSNINLVTAEEALFIAEETLNSGNTEGIMYGFSYCITATDSGCTIIYIDTYQDYALCDAFLTISSIVCGVVLLAVSIMLIIVADRVVAPIAESHNKQKQFVTNITHEFKTPLAIIKANTEVAEMMGQESQWTASTHNQIERLNKLVNNLLYLAKQQEGANATRVISNLSELVSKHAAPFVALAQNNSRTLTIDIEDSINIKCDVQAIEILVSVLLENAVKYSTEGSDIRLSLSKVKDKAVLVCSNGAEGLHVGDYSCWLDRFYKQDEARSSASNSFGIGLSTAQAIVDNHDGKISIYSEDGAVVNVKIEF